MKIRNRKIIFVLLVMSIIMTFFLFITTVINMVELLFILFLMIALFLLFYNKKYALFLFLLVRPDIDIISDNKLFTYNGISFNLNYLFGMTIILILCINILFIIKYKEKIKLSKPWIVFLTIQFVSIIYSIHIKSSIIDFTRLLSVFAMFQLGFLSIKNIKDFRQFLMVLIYSSIIPVSFGIYQYFTGQGMNVVAENVYNRAYGTFYHPASFSQFISLIIALIVILFTISKKAIPNKAISLILIPIMLFAVIITYTRGAWVILIVFFTTISIIKFRVILIPLLLIPLFLYFGVVPVHNRVNNTFTNSDSSLYWRINMLKDGLSASKDNFIFGTGIGTSEKVMEQKRGGRNGPSFATHNEYLKVLLESGIIGLLSFLFLLISLGLSILKIFKNSKNIIINNISLILLGLFIALYVWQFADMGMRSISVQWAWWSVIGAFLAITRNK